MKQKMMMLAIFSALLILAGCSGGAKYAKEQTVLDGLAKAMETLTSSVNSADTPDLLTKALGSFSGTMEKFLPQMKSLTTDHPEWTANPPDELKETFDKFNAAKAGFQNVMPKIMSMAKDNLDNADLQGAVNKFTSLMKDM